MPHELNTAHCLSIAEVERETGISKDTLRIWERRYQFPVPDRDSRGIRYYTQQHKDKLTLIKRLLDQGHKPSRILHLSLAELQSSLSDNLSASPTSLGHTYDYSKALSLVLNGQAHDLQNLMQEQLASLGLQEFVHHWLPPLNDQIGHAWMQSELPLIHEHLYSEQVQNLLRCQLLQLLHHRTNDQKKALLATIAPDTSGLGLVMLEITLTDMGFNCTSLGVSNPLNDLLGYAIQHAFPLVCLSFSMACKRSCVIKAIAQARKTLPESTLLLVGGSAIRGIPRIKGVDYFLHLRDVSRILRDEERWHIHRSN